SLGSYFRRANEDPGGYYDLYAPDGTNLGRHGGDLDKGHLAEREWMAKHPEWKPPVAPPRIVETPEDAAEAFSRMTERPAIDEDPELDKALSEGKYDDAILASRADLLRQFGDETVIDPDTGAEM